MLDHDSYSPNQIAPTSGLISLGAPDFLVVANNGKTLIIGEVGRHGRDDIRITYEEFHSDDYVAPV